MNAAPKVTAPSYTAADGLLSMFLDSTLNHEPYEVQGEYHVSGEYEFEGVLPHPNEPYGLLVSLCASGIRNIWPDLSDSCRLKVTLRAIEKPDSYRVRIEDEEMTTVTIRIRDSEKYYTEEVPLTGHTFRVVEEFIRCYGACYITIEEA